MRAARLRARVAISPNSGAANGGSTISPSIIFQAAYGPAAAQLLNRNEFRDPELMPPSKTEAPIEVDLRKIDIAHTDLFWGSAPDAGGGFRDVHTNFFPREGKLSIEGSGGTFQQAKWPLAQVQRFKLFYAKPELRIDEGYFTLGGQSTIAVLGNFHFEQPASFDLQLTFVRCPVAPFLSETQRSKLEAEFDATTHLQNQMGQPSPRASGSIAFARDFEKY